MITADAEVILAATYSRISDDKAGEEAGVGRQDSDAGKLAAARGLHVVAGFTDPDNPASAYDAPRPGYRDLMAAAARREFSVIIVWQTSRLWRNRRERAEGIDVLRRAGVSVAACRGPELDMSTATGRGMCGLLGEFDTMESEIKGERIERAQLDAAKAGQHLGGARPFGWRIVPDPARAGRPDAHRLVLPVVDPGEAARVRALLADLLRGRSLASLCAELNAEGITTTRKIKGTGTYREWTPASLRAVLTRSRNYGAVEFQGSVFAGAWPAIADEAEVRRARRLLADPARRTSTGNRVTHLMSGLAVCGVEGCGKRVKTGSVKGRDGARRRLYKCSREHLYRTVASVDDIVEAAVIGRLSRADARDLLLPDDSPAAAELAAEAEGLQAKIAEAGDMWESGELTRAEHRERTGRMRDRVRAIERQMSAVGNGPVLADLITASDVAKAWVMTPLDRQRAVIEVLMTVTILPGTAGRKRAGEPGLDPARVGVDIAWK